MLQRSHTGRISPVRRVLRIKGQYTILEKDRMIPSTTTHTARSRPDIVKILRRQLAERPVEGETYSLYGTSVSTEGYYRDVAFLADLLLDRHTDAATLLQIVREMSRNRRRLKRILKQDSSTARDILRTLREALSRYTKSVSPHLLRMSLGARFDRTLSMIEEQYHLAMLEIELVNRIHADEFARARTKLAFLPHCLRDWTKDCRSEPDGHDSVCRGCSKGCWVNGVSKMLRLHHITPYIWMKADLAHLFETIGKERGELGVLGIACVPELMHGMRLCTRHDIPVVGLPLNANRCARWMGTFHDNSVSLQQLAGLLNRIGPEGVSLGCRGRASAWELSGC